jgi:hypothetical protein
MTDHSTCEFCRLVSRQRLTGLEHLARSPHQAYFKGISVALEYWPVLTTLELAIRNSFSARLFDGFGSVLFETETKFFSKPQVIQIERCKELLSKRGRNQPSINDLVSNLNFGFWTQLVTKQYESRLWSPYLKDCFVSPAARDRRIVEIRLREAVEIRNRLAHHETVSKSRYEGALARLIETIGWVSPKLEAELRSESFQVFYT